MSETQIQGLESIIAEATEALGYRKPFGDALDSISEIVCELEELEPEESEVD